MSYADNCQEGQGGSKHMPLDLQYKTGSSSCSKLIFDDFHHPNQMYWTRNHVSFIFQAEERNLPKMTYQTNQFIRHQKYSADPGENRFMDGTRQSLECCAIKIALIVTEILEKFLDEVTKLSKSMPIQPNRRPRALSASRASPTRKLTAQSSSMAATSLRVPPPPPEVLDLFLSTADCSALKPTPQTNLNSSCPNGGPEQMAPYSQHCRSPQSRYSAGQTGGETESILNTRTPLTDRLAAGNQRTSPPSNLPTCCQQQASSPTYGPHPQNRRFPNQTANYSPQSTGNAFGSGYPSMSPSRQNPHTPSMSAPQRTPNPREGICYRILEYYVPPENDENFDEYLYADAADFYATEPQVPRSTINPGTWTTAGNTTQRMTLGELNSLCARRQKEIEMQAAKQRKESQVDSGVGGGNLSMCNAKRNLEKTINTTVCCLSRVVNSIQQSIDTSKNDDPSDPAELNKILAEKLLNRDKHMEDLRDAVKDLLEDLQQIVENDPVSKTQINALLEGLTPKATCPQCCNCGSTKKRTPDNQTSSNSSPGQPSPQAPEDKTDPETDEYTEGTGPPRKKFNQPTMYDHMESYCKFKRTKEREEQLLAAKEKCLLQNAKFTNLTIEPNKLDECLRNFSTQNLVKFKMKTKDSEEFEHDAERRFWDELAKKNANSVDSLINISRSPINCPVTACSQTIGITSVLSHFLRDHKQCFPVDFQDIDGSRRSVLIFDESIFNYNENACLGILGYGGKTSDDSSRPALAGICRANSFLPEKYSQFLHHLPILIMGCKTSLNYILADKDLGAQLFDPTDKANDLIILWLATVETTKTIHCTITAFDHDMTSSRSTIVEVRNLKYAQDPSTFMMDDVNFLMLNRGEINILSMNGQASIEIEVFIHEFDD